MLNVLFSQLNLKNLFLKKIGLCKTHQNPHSETCLPHWQKVLYCVAPATEQLEKFRALQNVFARKKCSDLCFEMFCSQQSSLEMFSKSANDMFYGPRTSIVLTRTPYINVYWDSRCLQGSKENLWDHKVRLVLLVT